MKYLTLFLFATAMFSCKSEKIDRPQPQVISGEIIMLDSFESQFIPTRPIDIWLPATYDSNKKYAVLYMHDAQMMFDKDLTWNNQEWGVDEVVSALIDEKRIEDCIVVGIHNGGAGRHGEYFPEKPFDDVKQFLEDAPKEKFDEDMLRFVEEVSISSDRYLKFLVTELKPFIDKTYSTYSDPGKTIIGGASMGGLISLYAICEYPEVFGGAACLSTHWIGLHDHENNPFPQAFSTYLADNLPDPTNHKIYFDLGTETLDSTYEIHQEKVDRIMEQKGFDDRTWMTRTYEGHDHSEVSWNKRLHIPLEFLLAK